MSASSTASEPQDFPASAPVSSSTAIGAGSQTSTLSINKDDEKPVVSVGVEITALEVQSNSTLGDTILEAHECQLSPLAVRETTDECLTLRGAEIPDSDADIEDEAGSTPERLKELGAGQGLQAVDAEKGHKYEVAPIEENIADVDLRDSDVKEDSEKGTQENIDALIEMELKPTTPKDSKFVRHENETDDKSAVLVTKEEIRGSERRTAKTSEGQGQKRKREMLGQKEASRTLEVLPLSAILTHQATAKDEHSSGRGFTSIQQDDGQLVQGSVQAEISVDDIDETSNAASLGVSVCSHMESPNFPATVTAPTTSSVHQYALHRYTRTSHLDRESLQSASAVRSALIPSGALASPASSSVQSKDVVFAELKAMKLASLQARNSSLLTELSSLRGRLAVIDAELTQPAKATVSRHIHLLHEYNDIRDIGQGLLGMIADSRDVRICNVMEEFGVGSND